MKEKRFKNLSNILVAVISITLLLWMIIVVVKFDNHTKEVCKNIDQISLKNSGIPVDDSKVLEYYDSRIGTEGVVVAFISVIVTFLAFYIQYVFNKQQKKDISSERTENQLFHLMDVYRNICNTSVVDGGIMGKRTFHYMFYEYKAIFNLINDYIATTTLKMSIEDKNYLAFVFFMNGFDYLRTREVQALAVAFQLFRATGKRSAMVVFLSQSAPLDHGSHGTVQNQYLVFK